MPVKFQMSKKPENKNAIDAVTFRAGTLGIYGRHLLLPNPITKTNDERVRDCVRNYLIQLTRVRAS